MEEDEFNEFLGLPSTIGATQLLPTTRAVTTESPAGRTMHSDLSGPENRILGKGTKETDDGYDALFGDGPMDATVEFKKPDLQSMPSLGHEPLFPDVDEAKIKPTVDLASSSTGNSIRTQTSQKEEFTIVLDPGGGDPRFTSPSNVPVADWVMQTGHNRREPVLMRQSAATLHGPVTSPRPSGLHASSGAPMAGLHGRSMTGSSGGSRTVRIPAGCNPDLEPEFPTKAAPDQALKLPGQTRVTPDEYKEFLGLGHGEIFNLDLDRVLDPPWRAPLADTTDFFNYGLDETTWKDYCAAIECHRQEFSMKKKIQTYESSNVHFQQDPDLPPEVAAAIAAEAYQSRAGTGPDMSKALPIPVFQGADDYSLRNRRGRDFRRPEVRYDPEVILELAGGVEPSTGINADYGEDYIGPFAPGDATLPELKPPDRSTQENIDVRGPTAQQPDVAMDTSNGESQSDANTNTVKEEGLAMFRDDDELEDPRSMAEMPRPGELAMGMDTDQQQSTQSWSTHKIPHPGQAAPSRPEFSRPYDIYAPPPDMWRPFYPGSEWRPRGGPYERGPPGYWPASRGYGRAHPDGGRGGGRYWHPYGGPRRPGRRPPPPRYHDEYRMPQYPPWPHREDPPPIPHQMDYHQETESKSAVKQENPLREELPPLERSSSFRDRDRRQHESADREDDHSRSHLRPHGRDYDSESRSFSHHRERERDRVRDYPRSHRRDEYDERHRDRRRSERSSERDSRRRPYSKERSRARERDERKSRRYETSGSDSESRYRNRSKDRD